MTKNKNETFYAVSRIILVLIVAFLSYIIGINDGTREGVETTLKYRGECRQPK